MPVRTNANNQHNTPPPKSKDVRNYFQRKDAELEALLSTTPVNPLFLKTFLKNVIGNYPNGKQYYRTSKEQITLFQKASTRYIQLFIDEIKQIQFNDAKKLEHVAYILDKFISHFPEEPKGIIHYRETPEYIQFRSEVMRALSAKTVDDDRFNKFENIHYSSTIHNIKGLNIESHLLQSLAKLHFPMDLRYKLPHQDEISLATLMKDYLYKANIYFTKINVPNEMLYTLAALNSFPKAALTEIRRTGKIKGLVSETTSAQEYDSLIRTITGKIMLNYKNWQKPEHLILAIHGLILASSSDSQFKEFLDDQAASVLLNEIATKLLKLDVNVEHDKHIAQQLYQIRNVYPAVFPLALSNLITPFIAVFNAQTHGSKAEVLVNDVLLDAANDLQQTYPDLIDPNLFDANNPINAELGLESDITYNNGSIKLSIQVEGDKYHKYIGTNITTQKTQLRDHCFRNDDWDILAIQAREKDKVNNQVIDQAQARKLLMQHIVQPTYARLTNHNIQFIQETNQNLASLTELLSAISSNQMRQKAEKVWHQIQTFENNLYEFAEYCEVDDAYHTLDELTHSLNSVCELLERMPEEEALKAIIEEVQSFDFESANKLAQIDQDIAKLDQIALSLQAKLEQLNNQLAQNEKVIQTNNAEIHKLKENIEAENKKSGFGDKLPKMRKQLQAKEKTQKDFNKKTAQLSADTKASSNKLQQTLDEIERLQNNLTQAPMGQDLVLKIDSALDAQQKIMSTMPQIETIMLDMQESIKNLEIQSFWNEDKGYFPKYHTKSVPTSSHQQDINQTLAFSPRKLAS